MFGFKKKKEQPETSEQEPQEVKGPVPLTPHSGGDFADVFVRGMRERRKYVRVKYPDVGAIGDLPEIEIKSHKVAPLNLSQEGLLVELPFTDLVIGQMYAVKIVWKYGPLVFNHDAELIRHNGRHFHFKFTKVDIRSFAEFSKSFSAGIKGAQTRLATGDEAPAYLLEFWKNPNGDKILFQKTSKGESIDLYLDGFRIVYTPEQGLLREEENAQKQWGLRPAPQPTIDETLILLSNIVEPTPRVSNLIQMIIGKHFPNSKLSL